MATKKTMQQSDDALPEFSDEERDYLLSVAGIEHQLR